MSLTQNRVPHFIHWFIIFPMKNCHLKKPMFKHTQIHQSLVKTYISWLNPYLVPGFLSGRSPLFRKGRLIEALQVIKLFGLKLIQVVNMLQFLGWP